MPQIVLFKKFSKIIKITVGILFIILLLICIYYLDQVFRIKTIIIDKNREEISINGIEQFKNKNLLLISKNEVVESLRNVNPRVKTIELQIIYPSTLTLHFFFEQGIINLETNKGFFILDNKGKILKKIKIAEKNIPILTYYQKIDHSSFQPGNSINYRDILLSLYFVENTEKLGVRVNTVDINSLYMILFKIGDKTVLFSTEKEKELQIYELSSILKRFKSEGNNYNTIDLRFDKPILKISD
ncbi:hypothetical protein COY87_04550 [Candidatus Roizmanbacteria bacterium CG_4_10_14_0_8_um_filter_33_9]|uniref:POTRA domain-containing protein n=1 Tax=Candidatus Roizmanbacteria bacterium CG_4_10_14_0_8_um_filter_33_9 TaxID=1974826 RepID=A0A2M7QIC8_9BACT|nr:MAG: hypothetical protein COY87_04550 [Candidatus Roizmanbacteria bacterium CG_4_10_14_0_8_um_filter_33_9]